MFEFLTVSTFYNFFQVKNGTAAASLRIADLEKHLQKQRNQTLSQIQQRGSQIYLGVFVTNIKSKVQVRNIPALKNK